jgi:ABC-2 type transport system ATP-binding protein
VRIRLGAQAMTSNASPALEVNELTAAYATQIVLLGLSLRVDFGEWVGLIGPNASGKTTLLHCVAGLVPPVSGGIAIGGCALKSDAREAKRRLGFACAVDRLPELLTGRQCLEVYAAAKGLKCVDAQVLELIELFRCRDLLDQFVATYSLGTRQKLCVLLALLGEPQLIVLDEAFNGLDPRSALVLKRHLRARVTAGRCGVLLATHDLDVVEHYADRVALLLERHIVHEWGADEMRALKSSAETGFEEALAAAAERA